MNESKNYILDMDGVLISGKNIIPGAGEFINKLHDNNIKYLVLTNNSSYTPRDLSYRLNAMGLPISAEHIFTSAMATARFLHTQRPNGSAFVLGENGLSEALHHEGYVLTDHDPDYVVLGEPQIYNVEQLTKAIRLIAGGARFIAANPDPSGPTESGPAPACGALAALIETASGVKPFFVGKPNPLMMRMALNHLGAHSENTIMVGDRMDTDIIAGVESGMETILVLSGITSEHEVNRFPYCPSRIINSVADISI